MVKQCQKLEPIFLKQIENQKRQKSTISKVINIHLKKHESMLNYDENILTCTFFNKYSLNIIFYRIIWLKFNVPLANFRLHPSLLP